MILKLILLSTATASISFLTSQSELFAGLRIWLSAKRKRKVWGFFHRLIDCGYCLGHWVAMALVLVYGFRVFQSFAVFDLILTALIVAWLSAFQYFIMMKLWESLEE